MKNALLTVSFLLFSACAPNEADPSLVVATVWEEWYATPGLREPSDQGTKCNSLEDLQVVYPATMKEFLAKCPVSNACQLWEVVPGRRVKLYYRPVAVISPLVPADRWPSLIVHEYLHAMQFCAWMGIDYQHANPLIWDHNDGTSVEERAEFRVYNPAETD